MEKEKIRIAHISDTHIRKSYLGNAMAGVFEAGCRPADTFRFLLERAKDKQADCVVISGDIVHEGEIEDYIYAKKIVKSVLDDRTKVIYVCGNHDRKEAFKQGLEIDCEGADIDYVDYIGDYRIVVLDSSVAGKENGKFTDKQVLWLKDILKEGYGKGTILTFHHPIVWDMPQMSMPVSPEFEQTVKESDVIGILCGHTHSNDIQPWNGIMQLTADSTAFGMELYQGKIAFVEKAGFNYYEIGNGLISAHVESANKQLKVLAEFDLEQMLKFTEEE